MSDSIRIAFLLPTQFSTNLTSETVSIIDSNGEIKNRWSAWMKAKSPLTGAGFKVKAILSGGIGGTKVIGYVISINVPACTVGNNVLLVPRVYTSCRIALLLLQHFLLEQGGDRNLVRELTVENCRIESVTLTYLWPMGSHDAALAGKVKLLKHATAVRKAVRVNQKMSSIMHYGPPGYETLYMKTSGFEIAAYVKAGPSGKAFAEFDDQQIRDALYAEGAKLLRVELNLQRAYLSKARMDYPSAWRAIPYYDPNLLRMDLLADYLRVGQRLRVRAPKPEYLVNIKPGDRELLECHLSGNDARQHPRVLAKGDPIAQGKYFSAVKRRVLEELNVDMAIPWRTQAEDIWPDLRELCSNQELYRIPESLRDHSFCSRTAKDAMRKLRAMIRALASKKKS